MDFLTRKVINPRQSRTSKKLGFHLQHLMVNFRLSKLCEARNFLSRAFIFATRPFEFALLELKDCFKNSGKISKSEETKQSWKILLKSN